MTDDLWTEASAHHETLAREAALALADTELEAIMPFLLASRSPEEYVHRSALAQGTIALMAASCGLDEAELTATARRRYDLYRQALAEGVDPLQEIADVSRASGGPEKPDEHDTGPAAPAYSEVPQGAPRGPNPAVTQVRPPRMGPVQEATGMRRTADAMTAPYTQPLPPDTGTGMGSVDTGMPDGSGGMTPSLPAGQGADSSNTPITPPAIGQVTSSRDPVRRRVQLTAVLIQESNPQLPAAECGRVARLVVGRYLQADLAGSVMNDEPVGSGSSGGGGGGSNGSVVQHGLEWQGLKSMMPGSGGGGSAAGEGAELADIAEVAAL